MDFLNKLANKGLKMWLIVVAAIILFAVISSALDSTPKAITEAKDELFNGYYDANIYENTSCKSAQIGEDWVILCERIGGESNRGIFEVKLLDNDEYVIYAVNGSAKTHAGRMGKPFDFNRQTTVDIAEVKKELG